mmetsp:Transcript_16583/g.31414  ORF Transcript_16583/g.31414 Transcript_16583/m.31414 type:complete len:206 (-) Transcript_16583:926-1543(-)
MYAAPMRFIQKAALLAFSTFPTCMIHAWNTHPTKEHHCKFCSASNSISSTSNTTPQHLETQQEYLSSSTYSRRSAIVRLTAAVPFPMLFLQRDLEAAALTKSADDSADESISSAGARSMTERNISSTSNNSASFVNDDPLAAFSKELNSIDFGTWGQNSSIINVPSEKDAATANGSSLGAADAADLLKTIDDKRKKKSIGPLTHG